MPLHVPIGIDDFRLLREQGLVYIDKSQLICELLDRPGVQVVLLPRPRRFGKSLNLSMLRCFFERSSQDLSHLFEDLAVWRADPGYRAHFQRYPVIHLTFKGVKAERFEDAWAAIREKLSDLVRVHQAVLDSDRVAPVLAHRLRQIVDGTAPPVLYRRVLLDLCESLHAHHGEPVVILIDEYDEPIHAGHVHGYAREIIDFFRTFLTEALKGNPHLYRAVLTGILRIARESIFSGLNNLAVCTLLRDEFATCFGFTEAEVEDLLTRAGRLEQLPIVQRWYNGYVFGGQVIYNPWSVLNFVADAQGRPRPHWLNTSSNDLIRKLLEDNATRLEPVFEILLAGGGIEQVLDENVVLDRLDRSPDALWSLLVFSGYLKAEERLRDPMEQSAHFLTIPNQEVRLVYTSTFRDWMQVHMQGHGGNLDRLTRALLSGDAETLEEQLQAFVENVLSYHDAGAPSPEQLYHGFVLGLLAVLEPDYLVRSNRESGQGRPDVMIRPARPGRPGAVLELKVARPGRKTLDVALEEGLAQMQAQGYAAELRAAGAQPIHAFAVAFDGKEVRVRAPSAPSSSGDAGDSGAS
jgi:hypothetical protein